MKPGSILDSLAITAAIGTLAFALAVTLAMTVRQAPAVTPSPGWAGKIVGIRAEAMRGGRMEVRP